MIDAAPSHMHATDARKAVQPPSSSREFCFCIHTPSIEIGSPQGFNSCRSLRAAYPGTKGEAQAVPSA